MATPEERASKSLISIIVAVGILFLLLGLIGGAMTALLGITLIGVGFYLAAGPGGILRKEQVLDSWSVLIEHGQGKAGEVFADTENHIKESKAPALDISRRKMAPGAIRGVLGVKRDFLVVRVKENIRLNPFYIFINARDYGNNLDVSWYLTYRPSILEAFLLVLPLIKSTPLSLTELDLFDQQDLIAYTTNCHHSLLKAVEKQMLGLNQDPSKIDRKTRGFLGIS